MREDYQEALDKMFPGGWALAYSNPDGNMRFSHYAPTEGAKAIIHPFWELAKEINADSEEEERWKP